jgi:hypothetical protein
LFKNKLRCFIIKVEAAITLKKSRLIMIVEKELRKLLHQLVKEEIAQISLGNSLVKVHVFDNSTKIALSAHVYAGGNFIPKSVRNCTTLTPQFQKNHITTYLNIEEDSFSIYLNYVGGLDHLNKRMFVDLLEEFSWLADEWRVYLDEHDKHDLVHVHIPRN